MIRLIPAVPQDYARLAAGQAPEGLVQPSGGVEPPEVLEMLQAWSSRLMAEQGWGHWLAVEGRVILGSLAVKDPVVEGRVEIGYGVAPAARGRGVATAAVAALLPLLAAQGVHSVTAETAAANPASGRVLQKNGFLVTGTRVEDEEGALVLWQRHLPER